MKEEVTITMSKDEWVAILSATEEVVETYNGDPELRDENHDWFEWLEILNEAVSTLNSIVHPEP